MRIRTPHDIALKYFLHGDPSKPLSKYFGKKQIMSDTVLTPYQDEEVAYQKYYQSSIAIPYDAKQNYRDFEAWDKLSMKMPKPQRALIFMQRFAKEHSPECFVDSDGQCIFCAVYARYEKHMTDCPTVLIQRFKE